MPSFRYDHVDLDFLNELCGDDSSIMYAIVQTSLQSIPEQITELRAAITSAAVETAAFDAHKLKGSFNFIGCRRVAGIAAKIEDDCREGRTATLQADMQRLETEAAHVFPELEHLLSEMDA